MVTTPRPVMFRARIRLASATAASRGAVTLT